MISAYDPWVNMLRGTVAAFAAGVGGADAVTVVPFDEPARRARRFGRRIARNISCPADRRVARRRRRRPGRRVVRRRAAHRRPGRGGLGGARPDRDRRALDAFGRRVAADASRGRAARARRRHARAADHRAQRVPAPRRDPSPGRAGDRRRLPARARRSRRCAPSRPRPTSSWRRSARSPAHTARAGFATNLLAAGGIAVDVAGATDGVDDLVAAYDGQGVVCLAGTDAAYAEWGSEAAAALRDGRCRAGWSSPGKLEPTGPTTRAHWASTPSTS